MKTMNKMKNNKLKLLKVALSLLLIGYLLKKINVIEVIETAKSISFGILFLCTVIYFISVCLNAIKWKVLLIDFPINKLLNICFRAQFYSIVLPGQLFGEVSKIAALTKQNISLERAATSVVMDKLTGLIGMIVIGTIGINFASISVPVYIVIFLLVSVALFLILLFTLQISFIQKGINKFLVYLGVKSRKIYKITIKFSEIINIWVDYGKKRKIIIVSIGIGAINQLVAGLQCYIMTNYFVCNITFWDVCWCMAALSIILLLPISFGGIGLREVSLVSIFALFLIPSEQSIIISFVLFLSQAVGGFFGGMLVFIDTLKIKKGGIKE